MIEANDVSIDDVDGNEDTEQSRDGKDKVIASTNLLNINNLYVYLLN